MRLTHGAHSPYHKHFKYLRRQAEISRSQFRKKFPKAVRKLESLELDIKDIRRHSAKMLSAAAIAGGLMATTPALHTASDPTHYEMPLSKEQLDQIIQMELSKILPEKVGPLSTKQEEEISNLIYKTLGIKAVGTLEGNHLNTTYGRIGGEQHLPRFPGDTIAQHDQLQEKGITAHRGAFGYFAESKDQMTPELVQAEKYYVAVQTLYLPNWNTDHKWLKPWYKFRKVLVVNPTNGRSAVAVIGDAGPAAWTGKHFGGSPELMAYLQPYTNKNNGRVILFFVDDANRSVALGPVENKIESYIGRK